MAKTSQGNLIRMHDSIYELMKPCENALQKTCKTATGIGLRKIQRLKIASTTKCFFYAENGITHSFILTLLTASQRMLTQSI